MFEGSGGCTKRANCCGVLPIMRDHSGIEQYTTWGYVLILVFQFDDVPRLNRKVQSNYLVNGNRGNIEDDRSVFDSEWDVLAGYRELCLFHLAPIWDLYA
jgi:hypothetical protein